MRGVDQLRLGQPERVLLLLIFLFQVLLRARRFSISTSVLRESPISIYFDFRPDDMHTDLVLGMERCHFCIDLLLLSKQTGNLLIRGDGEMDLIDYGRPLSCFL